MKREGQVLLEALVAGIFLALVVPHVAPAARELGGYGEQQQLYDAQQQAANRYLVTVNDDFCSTARRAVSGGVLLDRDQANRKRRLCGPESADEAKAIAAARKRASEDAVMSRAERNFRSHCAGQVSDNECNRLATLAGYK